MTIAQTVTQQIANMAQNAINGGVQQVPGMTEAFTAIIAMIEKRGGSDAGVMSAMAACRQAVGLPPRPEPKPAEAVAPKRESIA